MTLNPVPGLPLEQQPDTVLLRMCLWAEARGEPVDGQLAVGHVIQNRALAQSKTLGKIILARKQFSWTNDGDPNRDQVLDAWKKDPGGWLRADVLAFLLEHGLTIDPSHGATHYYNPHVSQPAWGRGHDGWRELAVIGRHVFGIAA